MSGIFGEHLFDGMGQATPPTVTAPTDAEFSSLISSLATPRTQMSPSTLPATGGKGAPSTYSTESAPSTSGGKGGPSTYSTESAPMPWLAQRAAPAPAADNTSIYIVGGVAVVGILAALFMMSSRRVTANRRSARLRHR